jgi:hypothetical protein
MKITTSIPMVEYSSLLKMEGEVLSETSVISTGLHGVTPQKTVIFERNGDGRNAFPQSHRRVQNDRTSTE